MWELFFSLFDPFSILIHFGTYTMCVLYGFGFLHDTFCDKRDKMKNGKKCLVTAQVGFLFASSSSCVYFSKWTLLWNLSIFAETNKKIKLSTGESVTGKYQLWLHFAVNLHPDYNYKLSSISLFSKRLNFPTWQVHDENH